jgi:hypothetical protein
VTTDFEPADVVRDVTQNLATKHPELDRATIEAVVREEVANLQNRPVHDYVAVLAQRAAKKRLKSA